jgi:hypothetical protein
MEMQMGKPAKSPFQNPQQDEDSFDDMYGSSWLAPEDIKKPFYSSIDAQETQTFNGQGGQPAKSKIVLTLRGIKKKLPLNKTNANNLAGSFTKNPKSWVGKPVLVKVEMTAFQGKPVKGIRIYAHNPDDMGGDAIPQF